MTAEVIRTANEADFKEVVKRIKVSATGFEQGQKHWALTTVCAQSGGQVLVEGQVELSFEVTSKE